nr:hypothetical protein [Tanacetum cinerariifolium]
MHLWGRTPEIPFLKENLHGEIRTRDLSHVENTVLNQTKDFSNYYGIIPTQQVAETQPAEEPVATANITRSLDAFKSAEEQGNQPKPTDAEKHVIEQNVEEKVKVAELNSMGDVIFEQLMDEYDQNQSVLQIEHEIPYDTKSGIKLIKRYQLPQLDDDDQITFLGPMYIDMDIDSNVFEVKTVFESFSVIQEDAALDKADSDLMCLSKSEEASTDHLLDYLDELGRTKSEPLDAFADKTANSDPISHLRKEISSLTTNVQKLESSITQLGAGKLEESMHHLVAKTHKASLLDIISDFLKIAIPEIITESVKQTVKPLNRLFNAFNKLKSARFVVVQKEMSKVLKTTISIRVKVRKGMKEALLSPDYIPGPELADDEIVAED